MGTAVDRTPLVKKITRVRHTVLPRIGMLPPGCAVPPRALLLHYPTTTPPERILVNLSNLLTELRSERGRINQAISALEGLAGPSAPSRGRPPKSQAAPTLQRRRTMSLAARRRISAAMKQRWAKWKGKSAPKRAKTATKKGAGRKPMSAAMRKKLSAMMKARWAAKKESKT